MTGNIISDIIIAVTTLLGTVFSFIKWAIPYFKKRRSTKQHVEEVDKFDKGMKALLNVADLMEELKRHINITRVVLLEISNSGDMPMPGSKMYATAITAKIDDEEGKTNREAELRAVIDYNRILIDDHYIRMLLSVKSGGVYKFVVGSEPSCLLKDIYTNEGVNYSEIFHIFTDGRTKKMFILSIATHLKTEDFESTPLRSFINTAVNGIRSNFETYRLL